MGAGGDRPIPALEHKAPCPGHLDVTPVHPPLPGPKNRGQWGRAGRRGPRAKRPSPSLGTGPWERGEGRLGGRQAPPAQQLQQKHTPSWAPGWLGAPTPHSQARGRPTALPCPQEPSGSAPGCQQPGLGMAPAPHCLPGKLSLPSAPARRPHHRPPARLHAGLAAPHPPPQRSREAVPSRSWGRRAWKPTQTRSGARGGPTQPRPWPRPHLPPEGPQAGSGPRPGWPRGH